MKYNNGADVFPRRNFLKIVAGAAGVMAVPIAATSATPFRHQDQWDSFGVEKVTDTMDRSSVENIVTLAIDEAKRVGATYAEARVTRTVTQSLSAGGLTADDERLAIGVRVLMDGAWGFTSSTYVTSDEVYALSRGAVEQARVNASVFKGEVELGSYPPARGEWITPVRIDPFSISMEEKVDYLRSLGAFFPTIYELKKAKRNGRFVQAEMQFTRQERIVANSEDSLFAQTLYQGGGEVSLRWGTAPGLKPMASVNSHMDGLSLRGGGWEIVLDAKIRDQIPARIEEAESKLFLASRPVDVGRYEVVVAGDVTASFVSATLGNATQLDRAMGYEANAGGTSYLGPDPESFLGTKVGSDLMSVTADRSSDKGLATVKWDDEGVEPESFNLVDKGVLVDYQSTREQSEWLSDWYRSIGRPVRSNGCSVAPSALNFPLQHTPNLSMAAGNEDISFDDMIRSTSKGIAFLAGWASTDFQSRSGSAFGTMREIVNGKLGDVLTGAEVLFDSSEIWKNLIEVGGKNSVQTIPVKRSKGQPSQVSLASVSGVAARFKNVAISDRMRKG